jgi:hypothetical protein
MINIDDSYSKKLNHYLTVVQGIDSWNVPRENNGKDFASIEFGEKFFINSQGFRGENFKKDTSFLFAGCSQTYGFALREESIWGVMLAKEKNISYANISNPGASAMHIVFNIFKYFEEYGHPKTILALFPDFYRIRTFLDSKILNQRSEHAIADTELNIFVNSTGHRGKDFLKYIKLPTTPDNIYSQEFTYMINSMFIKMLENYCNKNNITFIWTKAYNHDYYGNNEESFLPFKNYYRFDIEEDIMEKAKGKCELSKYYKYTCHENNEKVDPTWNVARDNAHFGTHANIHIKDFFKKTLKEKINDNTWG